MDKKDTWFLYIIETENGKLYTGITKNIEARFEKHLSGKGAKFLKSNKPKSIVYHEELSSHGDALRREYEIKKFSRKKKLELINLS